MKAIILAGGEGRRLRAVSGELPKPLTPVCGRSVMEHILRLLSRQGFTDVCAAVKYRHELIEAAFGDGSRWGVTLRYRLEDSPLGTAGAVKNCADFYGDEDFLVISGDAVCDFDLAALMAEHRKRRACATLALCRRSIPLRYGLAVTDEEERIRCFVEKPDWHRVVSDLVNTGIYVLSPRAMAYVPENRPFDFGKDLFPLLLEKEELLLGKVAEGYWCDMGTPLDYYQCCVDALTGKVRLDLPEEFRPAPSLPPAVGEAADHVEFVPCRDRAGIMGLLSALMLELGAEYQDGIRLTGDNYRLHISPTASRSALRLAVRCDDAEFAKALALSAGEVIRALETPSGEVDPPSAPL